MSARATIGVWPRLLPDIVSRGQTKTSLKMGLPEWIMLVVLSVAWGGAFLFYKLLDEANVPPFTIVLGRVGVAALALLPVLLVMRRAIPRSPSMWAQFLVLGAVNNVLPFSLIIVGEKQIDSGLASIFNATTPVFTALLAHLLSRDEKLSPNKVAGIVVALAGVVLLIGPNVIHGVNLTSIAQLACIGAAVTYGFGALYARRFRAQGIDPFVVSFGQLAASALIALPLALFEHPLAHLALPTAAWWAWIGLAIPSTAFAFVLYFRLIDVAGATNAASVTFLVPVSAVLLGTLVLGERLAPGTAAGMACIFAGLVALDGRIFARFRDAFGASKKTAIDVERCTASKTPAT